VIVASIGVPFLFFLYSVDDDDDENHDDDAFLQAKQTLDMPVGTFSTRMLSMRSDRTIPWFVYLVYLAAPRRRAMLARNRSNSPNSIFSGMLH
jgi:hypothetical protein